ncbi:carboxypeptidase s [Moniliophthora roreri]|nr:carboxypeptidase s [Moniliophthora roreri]
MLHEKAPSQPQKSTKLDASLRRFRLPLVFISLCCAWFWFGYQKYSVIFTGEPEAFCPQVDALVPKQNLFFWVVLGDTLDTDAFKTRAVEWLGGAVRVQTETFDDMGSIDEDSRWENRGAFHDYLLNAFPLVCVLLRRSVKHIVTCKGSHSTLELTKVNTYGLLYTWKGYDATLKPTLLAAHQDVVPVNPDTIDEWAYPPYSGHFDGERIWGRGSSDDKSGLIGILSAIEILLDAGFQPARTIVLSFGFDEEGGGAQGAGELAKYLLDVYGEHSFAFVIDEGGGLMEQFGTAFATPGVAEKGSMNVNIEVATAGGHSSVPPRHTSIGILSSLLVHIEENPFDIHIASYS